MKKLRYLAGLSIFLITFFSCTQGAPEVSFVDWRIDIVAPLYEEYLEILILVNDNEKGDGVSEVVLQRQGDTYGWYFLPNQFDVFEDPNSDGVWISLIATNPKREPIDEGVWTVTVIDRAAREINKTIVIQRPPAFKNPYVVEKPHQYFPRLTPLDKGFRISSSGTSVLRGTNRITGEVLMQVFEPGVYLYESINFYPMIETGFIQDLALSYNDQVQGLTFTRRYNGLFQPVE